jgi:tetratricopeptide (TPR) repeat protein
MAGRLISTAHALLITPFGPSAWDWSGGALLLSGCAYLVWRRNLWGAWIPISLAPFLAVSPHFILDIQPGPSRYLYVASAATAALTGAAFARLARAIGKGGWGYAPILPLLLLSHSELKRAESVSYYMSGRSYISQGQGDEAIDALDKAVLINPACIPLEDAYGRLFNTRLAMGRETAALLQRARNQLPQSHMLQLLADVLASETQDEKALERINRLIEAQRQSPRTTSSYDLRSTAGSFFANRGTGLIRLDALPQPTAALQRALYYDPRQRTALTGMAYILEKQRRQ